MCCYVNRNPYNTSITKNALHVRRFLYLGRDENIGIIIKFPSEDGLLIKVTSLKYRELTKATMRKYKSLKGSALGHTSSRTFAK